ncbi:ribonuclease III [Sphingomonas ursincola]|uniref:Ribonuclease 3 n=1 Tax=Sphingomonas ursincola TaxID=56361 RepID=A0A7V8RA91_9SPHN|nr:ribonuclease III [Sphingomonas ursincola]MBA1372764.1 ribonuclease III [Sphingomonas ursincola]MCH2239290.1 ribonuclease III [Blastomonas sp.]
MSAEPDLAALLPILDYKPRQPALFVQALTHGSTGITPDYQRLEFLGDRVLGMVIAELLYTRFPKAAEGQMSAFLNRLVSRESCAQIARACNLGPLIRLGKQARDDGGAGSTNILGDVVEALIGALYIDGGLETARRFVERHWADRLSAISEAPRHPKSELQEWAAARNRKTPVYTLLRKSGPDHDLRFTVQVEIKGLGIAEATGTSKQEAETLAAKQFLAEHGR